MTSNTHSANKVFIAFIAAVQHKIINGYWLNERELIKTIAIIDAL